jgi:ribonuclease-3
LEKKISYQFANPRLLNSALSHRSVGSDNNERLEFLGDAILGYVIASILYDKFPKATEGELSRLRATLVKGPTLASVARQLQLGDYLNLGPGELKSGGGRRESILAGAFEAVIGAVYLDSNIDMAREMILHLFDDRLAKVTPKTVEKDSKTRLQEFLQARRKKLPVYETISVTGAEHEQLFKVSCIVETLEHPAVGAGASRRAAEQDAAQRALSILLESKK